MSNNFKVFDENKSNILSDADYLTDTDRLDGFKTGVARSVAFNKALYQVSAMVKALADLVEERGQDALDSSVSSLKTSLDAALSGFPTGTKIEYFGNTPPYGYLKANGAAVLIASYTALTTAIYCGDSLNATALFGYKATQATDPSTHRSTSGTYIVLPDMRGEFTRGWDDSRGIDSGRLINTYQADELKSHYHAIKSSSSQNDTDTRFAMGSETSSWLNSEATGGTETRPRNIALLTCIKY